MPTSSSQALNHSPEQAHSAAETRYLNLAGKALTIFLILFSAAFACAPFFSKISWIPFQQDDFYYYLKVAINFAHGAGSTFNGIVPTNGYHPLWFALIAAMCRISSSPLSIQIFLAVTTFLACVSTFFLSRRLLSFHVANPLLLSALAAYVVLYSCHLFACGMEVTLAIPLLLAVALAWQNPRLWQPLFWPAAGFGLLLSALVLSRLDTLLIIALLAAGTLAHPALRNRVGLPQLAGVSVGLLPTAFYFLSNHIFFHTWLPVSGMAKQLKVNHLPSHTAWVNLFLETFFRQRDLIVIIFCIGLLPFLYRRLTQTQQTLYPVLLVFPFLYIFLLSCLSDWQLWPWYFYPFRPALCVALGILLLCRPAGTLLSKTWVAAVLAFAVVGMFLHRVRQIDGNEIYAAALDIRDFASTHPGIYAMGDRAGMVGYLLPQPIIQTEGLVMDKDFVSLIRNKTPLQDIFARYHVNYYVASINTPYTGCFHATEPRQAGPNSPHMTADLCQPPVASYLHKHWQTLIFRVEPEPQPKLLGPQQP